MSSLLRISEGAAIALHAVCLLAKKPESNLTTSDIAYELSVSETHLSKVMQRLVKRKIVGSERGPGGGFKLSSPAHEITLLDVFEAIESFVGDTNCILTPARCTGTECVFGCIASKVNELVIGFMGSTTLMDVASAEGKLVFKLGCLDLNEGGLAGNGKSSKRRKR